MAKLERLDQLKTNRIYNLEKKTNDLEAEIEILKEELDEFKNGDPLDVTELTPTSAKSFSIQPTQKVGTAEEVTVYNSAKSDLQNLNTGNH